MFTQNGNNDLLKLGPPLILLSLVHFLAYVIRVQAPNDIYFNLSRLFVFSDMFEPFSLILETKIWKLSISKIDELVNIEQNWPYLSTQLIIYEPQLT